MKNRLRGPPKNRTRILETVATATKEKGKERIMNKTIIRIERDTKNTDNMPEEMDLCTVISTLSWNDVTRFLQNGIPVHSITKEFLRRIVDDAIELMATEDDCCIANESLEVLYSGWLTRWSFDYYIADGNPNARYVCTEEDDGIILRNPIITIEYTGSGDISTVSLEVDFIVFRDDDGRKSPLTVEYEDGDYIYQMAYLLLKSQGKNVNYETFMAEAWENKRERRWEKY